MVWNAGPVGAPCEVAEKMASPVPNKIYKSPGEVHRQYGEEDGGSPSANKLMKKRRLMVAFGPRTPEVMAQGRLQRA
jgi:hypothetical protein